VHDAFVLSYESLRDLAPSPPPPLPVLSNELSKELRASGCRNARGGDGGKDGEDDGENDENADGVHSPPGAHSRGGADAHNCSSTPLLEPLPPPRAVLLPQGCAGYGWQGCCGWQSWW
jgi:hypothetical protein